MTLKLYTGTDASYSYRSDLPFGSIANPSGLAVRDDGSVFAVSGAAGATMVATAGSADTYAAWTDLTGSLDPASPIKALETT